MILIVNSVTDLRRNDTSSPKCFSENRNRIFPNSSHETSIVIIIKSEKKLLQERVSIFLKNIYANILIRINKSNAKFMKMIMYLDQVGCSPAILGWFSIEKSVSITYHTESLKTNS